MVRQTEHGLWQVEGTNRKFSREDVARCYEKNLIKDGRLSAPLKEEVEPKKRWWKR